MRQDEKELLGMRPPLAVAENAFALVGATYIPVKMVRRPGWVSKPSQWGKSARFQADRGIVIKESRESEIRAQIEDALESGGTIDGFVSVSWTVTGAVKLIPVKGRAIVANDTLSMARLLDRNMTFSGMDALRLLGLAPDVAKPAVVGGQGAGAGRVNPTAPMPKKAKTWTRLSGFGALKA